MVRHNSAVGSSQALQPTGLAFSSAVKMRPTSAKASLAVPKYNGKPGPMKSGQEDRLGYLGVVERCDSVDLIMPNNNMNMDAVLSPNKQAVQGKNLQLGNTSEDRNAPWKALPSRAFAQRPSSAHVSGNRHGSERPMRPVAQQMAVRGSEIRNQGREDGQKRPEQSRQGLNGIFGGRYGSAPERRIERAQSSPHAGTGIEGPEVDSEQIEHLRDMLRKKEEEKLRMERQNTALIYQNAELKEQVAHLVDDLPGSDAMHRARQRPWSASSAGSAASVSGRLALRIPNGAYRPNNTRSPQSFQRSLRPQRGSSAKSESSGRSPMRPSSSSSPAQAYHPPGFLVKTGYNQRGKPVYGFASLEHRAVYTPCEEEHPSDLAEQNHGVAPAGPDDREAFSAQPLPEKDSLFERPHRQFPVKQHARSRPQSANAAVRAAAAPPVLGQPRPGSARMRSSYAERVQHGEADAAAELHQLEMAEGEGRVVSEVLGAMRARAAAKHVRVIDFCLPFDKLRRGTMSSTEFRRALEAAGCFRDMDEQALRRVVQLFADDPHPPAVSSVFRPASAPRVGYAAFCEVLQPVGDRRVRLTADQKVLLQLGKQQRSPNALDSPLGANALSKGGESLVEALMERILARSQAHRVALRDLLGPLAAAAKSRVVTPNVAHSPGCISRSHFLRGIQSCNLGIRFSDEDLALLFCKYERNSEFNYYRFCRDLEMAEQRRRPE